MTVKIEIYGEDAGHAVRELAALCAGLMPAAVNASDSYSSTVLADAPLAASEPEVVATGIVTVSEKGVEKVELSRERGKPAPGRARRTKEEIAEDEAADKAEETAKPAISTGEERIGPEDTAEGQAQDAADEAAETETETVLTVDDLRKVMMEYANKFTMEKVQEVGPSVFASALGNPPAGEPFWKMSLVPNDKLLVVIRAWRAAIAGE